MTVSVGRMIGLSGVLWNDGQVKTVEMPFGSGDAMQDLVRRGGRGTKLGLDENNLSHKNITKYIMYSMH